MESFEARRLDVMGVQKTYIKVCRMIECMMGSESEVWKGIE